MFQPPEDKTNRYEKDRSKFIEYEGHLQMHDGRRILSDI